MARYTAALATKHPDAIIVSGGARVVDRTAETAAKASGLAVISYRPERFDSMYGYPLYTIETVTEGDAAQEIVVEKHRRINPPCFKSFGQAAFFRNGWIVDDADLLVAFWDGVSAGTSDTIGKANAANLPRYIYR